MKTRVLMASIIVLAAASTAASALTIKNQDGTAYTLKITPKDGKAADLPVAAKASAQFDCKTGCTINLGSANERVDGKLDTLVIKNGKFVM